MTKKTFDELPETLRNKIIALKTAHATLKGKPDPNAEAWSFVRGKQPKTRKQWNFIPYILMKRIDRNREKMGLSPIYNVDETQQ